MSSKIFESSEEWNELFREFSVLYVIEITNGVSAKDKVSQSKKQVRVVSDFFRGYTRAFNARLKKEVPIKEYKLTKLSSLTLYSMLVFCNGSAENQKLKLTKSMNVDRMYRVEPKEELVDMLCENITYDLTHNEFKSRENLARRINKTNLFSNLDENGMIAEEYTITAIDYLLNNLELPHLITSRSQFSETTTATIKMPGFPVCHTSTGYTGDLDVLLFLENTSSAKTFIQSVTEEIGFIDIHPWTEVKSYIKKFF